MATIEPVLKSESHDKEEEFTKDENKPHFYVVILSNFGFNHVNCDNDGLYNRLIVPKSHANYLFYSSCSFAITSLYGVYKKEYIKSLGVFLIFTSSINYWRNPVHGLRRNVDIVSSILGILINVQNSNEHPRRLYLILFLFFGLLFYPVGFYFQDKSIHLSTLCHSLIHIICNLVCISYYSDIDSNQIDSNLITEL